MNTLAITEAARATLTGTLPFPEIVAKLIVAGVRRDAVSGASHFEVQLEADFNPLVHSIAEDGFGKARSFSD